MSFRRFAISLLSSSALALLVPAAAGAVAISVDTTVDEYNSNPEDCALREAIEAANTDSDANADGCLAGSGTDLIELDRRLYRLTIASANPGGGLNAEGDLDVISDDLTINGHGAVIDANSPVTNSRAIEIANLAPPITVNINQLTIRGANTTDQGGGIAVFGATQAHVLNLRDSTVSGNRAVVGGGITVGAVGVLNVFNSTISGNFATVDGGGIQNDGDTTLLNTTVSDNTANSNDDFIGHGGGLYADEDAITILNTVVAGNRDLNTSQSPDCGGSSAVGSLGFSLLGDPSNCTFIALGAGNQTDVDARLGPLADNGGPTRTQALLPGSPAIDTASTGGMSACEATDQRGLPRVLGGRCDKGAYERVECAGVAVNRIGGGTADVLTGTGGADGFLLFGGADVARGGAGGDRACGGPGRDRLIGQGGKDRLLGQSGGDRLLGGKGRDRLLGGKGRDRCKGGPGRDRLRSC
jgi:CSLREA domain-containing protein